jgi:hypothetical protein
MKHSTTSFLVLAASTAGVLGQIGNTTEFEPPVFAFVPAPVVAPVAAVVPAPVIAPAAAVVPGPAVAPVAAGVPMPVVDPVSTLGNLTDAPSEEPTITSEPTNAPTPTPTVSNQDVCNDIDDDWEDWYDYQNTMLRSRSFC